MLDCLHIENIAVIEQADIRFHTGFNVLTGETGAGKSIIIDAINAVLGERVSRELVRTGSDTAHVTALFCELSPWTVDKLEALGFPPDEDGNLLIGRTLSATGKASCSVNGRPATAALLREIGKLLVDLHGQHENHALLSPEKHIEYLDRFGNPTQELQHYQTIFEQWKSVQKQLKTADMDESEKARRLDMLQYQICEIEAANLRVGEQEELLSRRTLYRNAEKVAGSLGEAQVLMLGDENQNGTLSMAQQAVSALQQAARYMEQASPIAEQLRNAVYEMDAAAEELRGMAELLDFDSSELDATENRLEVLRNLTAKYGSDEQEILAFLQKAKEEYEQIELSDEHLQRLSADERVLREKLRQAASVLTEKRLAIAEEFSQRVKEQLMFLDMPQVSLKVAHETVEFTANGADKLEFLMSANVGEPPKPIARIASGGELSRIMLAMKSVLADADDIDTLIFDEIDTGISGRAAQKVGVKLRQTADSGDGARHRQVLCVTHLAQIAALAQQHCLIQKSVRDGRTFTDVTILDKTGREQELARIIGGTVTEANLNAARAMLCLDNP